MLRLFRFCGCGAGVEDTMLEQNPAWTVSTRTKDGFAGAYTSKIFMGTLPPSIEDWSHVDVKEWLRVTDMEKMQWKLQGMDGKALLNLSRTEVKMLTQDTMDLFVFSAHLGDLRRRAAGELELSMDLTGASTPRLNPASMSPAATLRMLDQGGSGTGLFLDPEADQSLQQNCKLLVASGDTKEDDIQSRSVDVIVKAKVESATAMLIQVLREAQDDMPRVREALQKAEPRRFAHCTDIELDATVEAILAGNPEAALGTDVCEAIVVELWQPLVGDSFRGSDILRGGSSRHRRVRSTASELTNTSVDTSLGDPAVAEALQMRNSQDELVPIRAKFQASPREHVHFEGDSTLDISRVDQDYSNADMSIAGMAVLEAAICVERKGALGDLDDSRRQMVENAVLYQVRNSPRNSPRFLYSNPNSARLSARHMAPVIMEDSGEGEEGSDESLQQQSQGPEKTWGYHQQTRQPSKLGNASGPSSTFAKSSKPAPSSRASDETLAITNHHQATRSKLLSGNPRTDKAGSNEQPILSGKGEADWLVCGGEENQTMDVPKIISFDTGKDAKHHNKNDAPDAITVSEVLLEAVDGTDGIIHQEVQNRVTQPPLGAALRLLSENGEQGGNRREEPGGGDDDDGNQEQQGGADEDGAHEDNREDDGGDTGGSSFGASRNGVYGVPELPEYYVQRPEIFDKAKREIMAGKSVAILGIDNLLGIGASTLAAAVALNQEVVDMYSGGVFWLSHESGSDEHIKLQELAALMMEGGYAKPFENVLPDMEYFQAALEDKMALLVLDDCLHFSYAKTFAEFGFTLIVTSRDQSIARQLDIPTCVVPPLEGEQALEFLQLAHGGVQGLEDALETIAAACGGLPMEIGLLTVLGKGRSRDGWKKIARKMAGGFCINELKGITGTDSWVSLMKAMAVAVDMMPISKHALYKSLAILPHGVKAPLNFLCRLWNIEGQDGEQSRKTALANAETMQRHGLLTIDRDAAHEPTIRLHELHSQFLVEWCGDKLEAMHERLLASYRKGETSFAKVADDGYYLRHVPVHLKRAGREPQLRMLLFDSSWLEAKLHSQGLYSLLSDFALYLEAQEDEEVKLLMNALQMSVPAMVRHPEICGLLSAQISCRLRSSATKHKTLASFVESLAARWDDQKSSGQSAGIDCVPSLWPRGCSLMQAGGSLLKTFTSAICAPTKFLSMTPDGSQVLTVEGRVARLWDTASGYCIRVLEGFKDSLMNGALSPDGRVAVTIADFRGSDIGRVWDCESGRCTFVLEGHEDLIQDLQISPDSHKCITASYDKTARLWDLSDGRCLHIFRGHSDYIEAAAFSPDGLRAATASWDSTARIWDCNSGVCLHILEGHQDRVWRVAVGRSHVVTTSWDMVACVWDLENGEGLWSLEGHSDMINMALISNDDQLVVTSSQDGTARVWDIQMGICIQEITGQSSSGKVAMSPDGMKMVTISGTTDTLAHVWDLKTGACLQSLNGHGDKITGLAITTDGMHAVTASWDRTARLWDLKKGSDGQGLSHQSSVQAVCLHGGCASVISSAVDASGILWGTEGGAPIANLHALSCTAVTMVRNEALNQAGAWIAAGIGADECLRLWDPVNGSCLQTTRLEGMTSTDDPNDAAGATGVSVNFSLSVTGAPVAQTQPRALLDSAGRTLVSCASGCATAEVWMVHPTRNLASIISQLEHDSSVALLAVAALRQGEVVATLAGNNIHVWDAMDGEVQGTIPWSERRNQEDGHIVSLSLTGDGSMLVIATEENALLVWDVTSLEQMHALKLGNGAEAPVAVQSDNTDKASSSVALALAKTAFCAATSSSGGLVELWDLPSGTLTVRFERTALVSAISISESGSHVAAACADCSVLVWEAARGSLIAMFVGDAPFSCCAICTPADDENAQGCPLLESNVTVAAGDTSGQVHILSP